MDVYTMLRLSPGTGREELQNEYARVVDVYRLVARFSDDPHAAALAQKKLDALILAGKTEHLSEEVGVGQGRTEQTELAYIRMALNSERETGPLETKDLSRRLEELPDSPESRYLKAVLCLRKGGLANVRTAADHLAEALRADPENEAYRCVLETVLQELEEYDAGQRRAAAAEEARLRQMEQNSRRAVNRAERRRFLDSAGPVVRTLVCIGIPVGLGIFVCYSCVNNGCW